MVEGDNQAFTSSMFHMRGAIFQTILDEHFFGLPHDVDPSNFSKDTTTLQPVAFSLLVARLEDQATTKSRALTQAEAPSTCA